MFAFAESSQTRPRNKHVSGANIYLLADFSASLCSIACHLHAESRIISPARFLHIASVFWHEMLEWKVIQLGDEVFRGRALAEITRLCKPLLDGSGNAFGIEPQIRQKLVDLAVGNERVVNAQNQRGDRGLHARQLVEHTFASAP